VCPQLSDNNLWKATASDERYGDCFSSKVRFNANKHYIGQYECEGVDNKDDANNPNIYVYENGRGFEFWQIKHNFLLGDVWFCKYFKLF